MDALLETVLRKRADVVSRDVAGETILVPVRGDLADLQKIFTLTPVAAHIWESLDGERNLRDILDGVVDAFEVGRQEAEKDLHEFADELLASGLACEVG
jgi:hypothetical protein